MGAPAGDHCAACYRPVIAFRNLAALSIALLATAACGGSVSGPTPPTLPVPSIPTYNRDDWPHWIDADGDCQDARQEVLIEESIEPVVYVDDRRCRVASGLWRDPYSGQTYRDPGVLDIDHLVPLANAHASGGWMWATDRKRDFANDLIDPGHLVAVSASLNRSKGAETPATWRPPDRTSWCWYARAWLGVKHRWVLESRPDEQRALAEILAGCS